MQKESMIPLSRSHKAQSRIQHLVSSLFLCKQTIIKLQVQFLYGYRLILLLYQMLASI